MATAFFLQKALIGGLEKIFKSERYPSKNGDMTKLSIFEQSLPVVDAGGIDDEQEQPESGLLELESACEATQAPYIQVILLGGKTSTVDMSGTADILLYLCVLDDGEKRDGYQYIVNMIQKIQERFSKNFMIEQYRCGEEIQWEIAGTDDHPFYFGAISMNFQIPAIRKEDDYC